MELKNIEKSTAITWTISRTLLVAVLYAITHLYVAFADMSEYGLWISILVLIAMIDALGVLNAWVLPILQQRAYRYAIKDDEVYVENGVLFRQSTVLPIVQLQDVGYTQGPIQRMFGLATLHVSTAGSDLAIEGLKKDDAIAIVDDLNSKAKELVLAKKQEENA